MTSSAANASPPDLYYGASANDPVDNETVYFGGCSYVVCATNYTWVFSRGTWTNITNPFDAPPARYGEMMDYDPNMQAVLLFGGINVSGSFLADTWIFQGGVWTNLTWVTPSGDNPTPEAYGSMAFDPDPEVNGSVLYGGEWSGGDLNTTYVWEAWSGWVPWTTSDLNPGEIAGAGMAFDAADDYMVFYGGSYYCLFCFNTETWEFVSGNWFPAYPAASPSEYAYASSNYMVYDSALSGVVLFGGINSDLVGVNSTWLFSNGDWSNLTPSNAPPDVYGNGFSLDPTGSTPLLVGGDDFNTGQIYNDTWVFEVPPTATLSADAPTHETGQPITFTATVSGGTVPYNATFAFGDGTRAVAFGSGPDLTVSHTYATPGSYTPTVSLTDADGATTQATGSVVAVAAGPVVAAHALPSSGDVGFPIAFNATAPSPGVGTITYAWSFGDGHSGTGADLDHTYTSPGIYAVNVTGTDSLGGQSTATVDVAVAPDLTLSPVASDPLAPVSGAPAAFFANVTGGTGPFVYAWHFGDGGTSSFQAPQHTYNHSGTYTVEIWVNDSIGDSAHESGTVTVGTPPVAASSIPLWFIGGLVAILVVGAALAVVLLRRNRTKGSSGPGPMGPS